MKKLKIFPKMFIQIFSVLSIIVLLIHISIYLIFPKTYLDTREAEINKTANEISYSLEGKNINDIKRATELYSKNSDIKVFVSSEKKDNEVEVSNDLNINLDSPNNSLIIEERRITLNEIYFYCGYVAGCKEFEFRLLTIFFIYFSFIIRCRFFNLFKIN